MARRILRSYARYYNEIRVSKDGAVHYVCMDWCHIGHLVQASFGQQILDVTIAQGEPKVEPDCMPDDVGREAVTGVGDGFHQPT